MEPLCLDLMFVQILHATILSLYQYHSFYHITRIRGAGVTRYGHPPYRYCSSSP